MGGWVKVNIKVIPQQAEVAQEVPGRLIKIIIWIGVQFHDLPPGSTAASVAYFTVPRFLNVPTLAARCLSRPQPVLVPYQPEEELWARNGGQMVPGIWPRVLLHATNLRHGTDNFTSLPKEGVLRIFYRTLKIQRLRPGLNPWTWVSEASTLPLHHRSRFPGRLRPRIFFTFDTTRVVGH